MGEQVIQHTAMTAEVEKLTAAQAALTAARRAMDEGQAGEAAMEVAAAMHQLGTLHSALVRANVTLLRQGQANQRLTADERLHQVSGPAWQHRVQAYLQTRQTS